MTEPPAIQLLMRRPHLDDPPPLPSLAAGYELRTWDPGDDDAALAAVLAAAFAEPWPVERVRSALTRAPDVRAVYVVTWNGALVATASSRSDPERFPGSGYVHWVGAVPEHAGRGLGIALMARLLADFRARGERDAVLETDDMRLPAIRTYLRCGFVPVLEVKGEDHRPRWSTIFQALGVFSRRA